MRAQKLKCTSHSMSVQSSYVKAKYWLDCLASTSTLHIDLQVIEDAYNRLDGLNTGALCSSFSNLQTGHLFALITNKWLCDEHLNACGEYINSKLGPQSIVHVLSSYFIVELCKRRRTQAFWSPPRPRTLDTSIAAGIIQQLIIPIHTPGHWTVMVIDLAQRTYTYTDTLDLATTCAPLEAVQALEWWLSAITASSYTLSNRPRDFEAEEQNDSSSCGPAVMSTMSHIALSSPQWCQLRAPFHRIHWFLKLSEPVNSQNVSLLSIQTLDP